MKLASDKLLQNNLAQSFKTEWALERDASFVLVELFKWIYISRISLVNPPSIYFTSITKIFEQQQFVKLKSVKWKNKGPFVKYATLEKLTTCTVKLCL